MADKKNKTLYLWLLDYGIVLILLLLILIFSIASSNFFSFGTLTSILRQVSIIGIISVGAAFVILTAGIDLSVGSVACISSLTAALLLKAGFSIPIAIIVTLMIAVCYGIFSGCLVSFFKMSPLIATLGMMTALRGAGYLITDGLPVYGFGPGLSPFGRGYLLGIPYPVILMLAVFAIGIFVLSKTPIGRHIYGVGGNEEASRLSGVNVNAVKIFTYAFCSFLSGVAGLVLLSRTNSGQPAAGVGFEMDSITAVVLGGVSLMGGQGRLSLVIIGVLIMGVLSTGMLMCNINDYVQQVVKGMVLIAAVALSYVSLKMRDRIIAQG
ncbi:ABC transporter permease [Anaerobiospirillum sp. NML120448]|uniref:ABC transporter permease n=1 Tax=Anaerobiospirillum sp. NML120448 TaxID=2932816 RepID=UPI001FF46BE7|nr:ABC transporter permease [Anaerobiospirillum sp. NML120448]MCK0515269.1 ABC transporter permease [Anaerobiospirillum sp. NML120448]